MEMIWDWKSITSLLATIVFLRTVIHDFLPPELRHFLRSLFHRLYSSLRPTSSLIIDEFDSSSSSPNDLFDAATIYLSSRCLSSAPVLRLSKTKHSKTLTSSLPNAHSVNDEFEGVQLKWSYHAVERSGGGGGVLYGVRKGDGGEKRYFEVKFNRRDMGVVRERYVNFVLEEAARLKLKGRERRLYTNRPSSGNDHHGYAAWSSVPFHHPSTFDTLAIDLALRDSIRSDLLRFSSRRDYYSRVGRAWKRGYLLHGPPGTGKTSLIAAIANFLAFDLYDLELTAVHSNSQLRKLLISTSPKSVIVVEDADCSLDLTNRKKPTTTIQSNMEVDNESPSPSPSTMRVASVSLSGVLNFVDGLWSSCVGERLMIFTTNHPERLDPALLRPGRMDRKIHLSYCEAAAFRILARNYLEVEDGHELMEEVEGLLKEVKVTPAEIAEVFVGCDGCGADVGMRMVVEELRRKKKGMCLAPLLEEEEVEKVD